MWKNSGKDWRHLIIIVRLHRIVVFVNWIVFLDIMADKDINNYDYKIFQNGRMLDRLKKKIKGSC